MASTEAAKITKFEIIGQGGKLDLLGKGGVPLIEYRENIFDHTVRIRAIFMDSDGAIDKADLQGDEKVSLSITHDGKTISYDQTLRIQDYQTTYDSLKYATEINLVTFDFLNNIIEETKTAAFYSGKISDSVTSILEETLKISFPIKSETTLNTKSFHGKITEPFEMVSKLCRYCIPSEGSALGKVAGFLFFFTHDGYVFKSVDALFKQSPKSKFIKNDSTILPPGYDGKIYEDCFYKGIDVEKQLRDGAYGVRNKKWNPLTMVYDTTDVDFFEGSGGAAAKLPKFPDFSKKVTKINKVQVDISSNKFDPGDPVSVQFKKIQNENIVVKDTVNKSSRLQQLIMKEIWATVDGDIGIYAGDMVECEFRKDHTSSSPSMSKKMGGKYLVSGVCHQFTPSTTFTKMNLMRDSDG